MAGTSNCLFWRELTKRNMGQGRYSLQQITLLPPPLACDAFAPSGGGAPRLNPARDARGRMHPQGPAPDVSKWPILSYRLPEDSAS
jgi:hypothetical protein